MSAKGQELATTPWFITPLLYVLLVLGLTFQSTTSRASFFIPILSIAYWTVSYTTVPDKPLSTYFQAISAWETVFQALDYLVLTDPYAEFRLVGQTESPLQKPFLARLVWGLRLVAAPRGVGWNHEPKKFLPPHPEPQSRFSFIFRRQIPSALISFVIFDAAYLALRSHPGFLPGPSSIADVGPFMRFVNVLIFATSAYYFLDLQYRLFSIAMTASGMYRPDEWPDFLGSWSEAYTVRRFWDRTWYQKMRRWRTVPGDLIAQRWIGLKVGSRGCEYTKLFVGFCMNALMHQIADYALRQRGFWDFTSGGVWCFLWCRWVRLWLRMWLLRWGGDLGYEGQKRGGG
ncbi:hypothetical protein GYMLUDRAFT_890264 [Collybiopsis luxurians FD-317 M1]|uniref:Wax synthase domain-containing protein n=1 Tax=Collybiopsis luxurians FD-317 M1 TaxID=944289 RepID=A0A0D0AWK0_9AGAR|nr:hypothetical protein GYMLUDRAFT_890264 [Collybiopsis luxurians FD-317 M1]